jgi:xanthine dehydrogenase small subunit
MRGTPETMTLLRPRTAAEAVRLYGAVPGALPLAGGTDLMVAWNLGELDGRSVLDLSALDAWRRVVATKRGVRIGALATHAAIRDHPAIRRLFPLLAASGATVGGIQIQNRGTLGGNLANASPAGDTFPALAVYEAVVLTRSVHGRRRLRLDELFAGPKQTRLEPGELIEAVELAALRRTPDRVVFRKVGTRAAQAISKVVVAGLLWLTPDGRVEALRVAAGSVAPTVKRLRAVERAMIGVAPTEEAVERALARLTDDIAPIDDIRSTRDYRLLVCRRLVEAFLRQRSV